MWVKWMDGVDSEDWRLDSIPYYFQELVDAVNGISQVRYSQSQVRYSQNSDGWPPTESTDSGWSPVESTDDYENPYFRQTGWWPIPDEVWQRNYEPKQEDGVADREAETPKEEDLKELFE